MNRPMSLRDLAAGAVWLVMLGGLSMLAWFAAGGYAVAWIIHPVAAAVLTVTHLAVFALGLSLRDRRRAVLAESNGYLDEDLEAKKLAAAAADGVHVNTGEVPLFGVAPTPPVVPYDWAAEDDSPASLPRSLPGAYGRFWR